MSPEAYRWRSRAPRACARERGNGNDLQVDPFGARGLSRDADSIVEPLFAGKSLTPADMPASRFSW
jgi:hypothetical protein